MANPRVEARTAVLDYARSLIASDPVCMAMEAASVAALPYPPSLSDLASEADRVLPPNVTPFERGMMMGAALVLALTPGE